MKHRNWSAVALDVMVFVIVLVATPYTFFIAAVPVLLIGLPMAIFAKSVRAKRVGMSAVLGSIIWIPIYLTRILFQ